MSNYEDFFSELKKHSSLDQLQSVTNSHHLMILCHEVTEMVHTQNPYS
jgi:hypothetical protein